MKHEFYDGKYAVEITEKHKMIAYRYGDYWQDLTGNKLVYWMIVEIDQLKAKIAELENKQ